MKKINVCLLLLILLGGCTGYSIAHHDVALVIAGAVLTLLLWVVTSIEIVVHIEDSEGYLEAQIERQAEFLQAAIQAKRRAHIEAALAAEKAGEVRDTKSGEEVGTTT